jgi:hypothetical protein
VAFTQLVNAQQVEIVVAGPGDVNRLYVCKGLAQGQVAVQVAGQQSASQSDTWQFEVGPTLDVGQFRRAIATVALAGLSESQPAGASASWAVLSVIADFDDDAGKVRVSATNQLSVSNPTPNTFEFASLSTLGYDVTILAALPA